MESAQDRIVVTGANGHLGLALLRALAGSRRAGVRAVVRSERARRTIESLALSPPPEIRIVDYASPNEMERVIRGARAVVHLVGILKETRDTRYEEAHERTCHALAVAAPRADVQRLIYVSILGARPDSTNPCLASKGRAESLLLDARTAATVLRVPMVLGGDDPASATLRRQARARRLWLVGGGRTLQQPMDVRDLIRGLLAASAATGARDVSLDAGGPVCLSHRNLVLRAARLWSREPEIRAIPPGLARLGVAVLAAVLPRPPVTVPMLDVLQQDDRVDPAAYCRTFDLTLTPLETTLADFIGPDRRAAA